MAPEYGTAPNLLDSPQWQTKVEFLRWQSLNWARLLWFVKYDKRKQVCRIQGSIGIICARFVPNLCILIFIKSSRKCFACRSLRESVLFNFGAGVKIMWTLLSVLILQALLPAVCSVTSSSPHPNLDDPHVMNISSILVTAVQSTEGNGA